ncbi:hypothetical protein DFS34DRAFT_3974 [Phlyctochytrium arcticum]|nr:hypothetical protein DFS34DRAFT_3974 [Phlyctochytrium arcticum]
MLLIPEQYLTLPLIDISAFLAPDSAPDVQLARQTTAEMVDQACRDVGFFYLTGHGISEAEAAEIRDLAKEFFDLDDAEKDEIHISKSDYARGYQRLGQNITLAARDWHEGVDLYAPASSGGPLLAAQPTKTMQGSNPIPRRPARFQSVVDSYVEKMKKVGEATMRAMAMGLGLDEHFFEPFMKDGFWVMRLIGYPPLNRDVEGVGVSCGEHTDYGCLTILNTDSTPNALQVKSKKGEWIFANRIPGAFVINIGDMVNVWTNGLYTSTLHRVIHTSNSYRVSVPFFYEPRFDAKIEPLPSCVERTGGEKKYEGVVYGEHLMGKVVGNFDVGAGRY